MCYNSLPYFIMVVGLVTKTCVFCEPLDNREQTNEDEYIPGFEIEYSRYMKEVSSVLEADKGFQKPVDSNAGDVKDNLEKRYNQASELTRTKLDELKRIELRRLKDLHKKSMRLAAERQRENAKLGIPPNKKDLPKTNEEHVDSRNPHSFSAEDLKKLIHKTTKSIANIDLSRRTAYKQHAMDNAYKYKSKFRDLPAEQKQEKLKEHLELAKKHAKINHPGNLRQLKEVWSKQDFMGGTDFDPKTFFMLRDVDSDGLLSPSEIEAFFEVELDKLYGDVDLPARDEDMNRMREHMFTEVDLDKDGMVSLFEFIKSTNSEEYKQDGDWQSVLDEQQFTDEELKEYEESLQVKDLP